MRVLIFSLSYLPMVGGAELAIKEITERISPTEIEFDLVTLKFGQDDPSFERIGNVNVYRIGGSFGYLSKILFIWQASRFAKKREYDLYWSMMTYMSIPALWAKKAPFVLTMQDGDTVQHVFNRWFILPFRHLISRGFKEASKVQAISHFLAEWSHRDDVLVIPNGVDLNRFNPTSHPFNKVLITTSRLVAKNGVGDLITAMKFLPEDVMLNIIGTGPLEKSLKLKAKSLKFGGRVRFVGNVPNSEVPKYLSEADIFVRPSLSEGQGIAFIEAMASGLPVVATPVGGIVDFVRDGETGVLCRPNDPEGLAKAILSLINDSTLRGRVVTNALQMVRERYSWDLIAEEMRSKVFKL